MPDRTLGPPRASRCPTNNGGRVGSHGRRKVTGLDKVDEIRCGLQQRRPNQLCELLLFPESAKGISADIHLGEWVDQPWTAIMSFARPVLDPCDRRRGTHNKERASHRSNLID